MKRKMVWLGLSCLLVLALLVTACAKKAEEAAPAAKEAAPVVKEAAPVVKEAAPVVKETAAAATEAPKYGGTMILGLPAGTKIFDPAIARSGGGGTQLSLENLAIGDWAKGAAGGYGNNKDLADWTVMTQYSPTEIATGCLAESWEFPDDTTIIYHIRKGVHWALDPNKAASRLVGGRELTADDVVFSIKRSFFDPQTVHYNTSGASRPTDVYATDKYTVVVKGPPGLLGMTFLNVSFQGRVTAPEVVNKYGDYQAWENNVGTGPYIVTDYVSMSSVTWRRNPNYYLTDPIGPGKGNQLPYVDSIKALIIPDTSTRMAALRTSKIDYDNTAYPAEYAKSLIKTTPRLKFTRTLAGWLGIGMRQDGYKPGLPWAGSVPYFPSQNPNPADVNAHKVRRALNLATNNQEICDTLFMGEGELVTYGIAPVRMYKDAYTPPAQLPPESRELFEYHPDKAKQLLTEAGYPNGFKTQAILSSGTFWHLDYAQMLKAQLAKIGVDLDLKVVDPATYLNMQVKHSYEEIFFTGRITYGNHMMYELKAGDQWNNSDLNDPQIQDYYKQVAAAANFDTPKLNRILKELNLYVIPRAHYIYVPTPYVYLFWQPWLKNYSGEVGVGFGQIDAMWRYVWLDQELRQSMAGR